MNRNVFLSILAMDSYQRGYVPGINGVTGASIGSANVINIQSFSIDDAKYSAWQDVGFYASAYDWNGTTVISSGGRILTS